jgi:hypothetical protein
MPISGTILGCGVGELGRRQDLKAKQKDHFFQKD